MGTAFTTAVGNPPPPWTFAYREWRERLLAFRQAECPVARGTRYYIKYDGVNGNSTGHADVNHDGSLAKPWVCASPSDLNTLIHAQAAGGDKRFSLRRGDEFYSANNGTGINLQDANITLDSYSDGTAGHLASDAPPEVSGFKAPYGASGWTQVGATNVWWRSETDSVKWLRWGKNKDRALAKANITGAGQAVDANFPVAGSNNEPWGGSFFHDTANVLTLGANRLYVRLAGNTGPNTRSTIQACVSALTSYGIEASADGVRVDGIAASGWGMNTSVTQTYPLIATVTGTSCCLFSNCEAYWGASTHTIGLYVGSGTGGIATFLNCAAGLCMAVGGSATVINHFCDQGGQEVITWGCSVTQGALKDIAVSSAQYLGAPLYGHCTGTNKAALFLAVGTSGPKAGSSFGLSNCSSHAVANLPAQSGRDDWASLRCFFDGDEYPLIGDGGSGGGILGPWARINNRIRWVAQGAFSTGAIDVNTGGSGAGFHENSTYTADFTGSGIAAGSFVGFFNIQAGHSASAVFWNTSFVPVLASGLNFLFDLGAAPSNMAGSLWLNTLAVNVGGDISATYCNAFTNGVPTSNAGGASGACFLGFTPATNGSSYLGYDSTQSPTTLASVGEGLAPPEAASSAGYLAGAGVHPLGYVLEFDREWRPRLGGSGGSAGPVQAYAVKTAPARPRGRRR